MNSVPVNVLGHRYVVQEEKGCGSYGTVFAMKRSVCTKAHCTCPPPLLALKVFDSSEGSGEGLCQTTLRETHAMLALKHENVMPITHMCWDLKWPGVGRRFGMAMPLMEGNLKDLVCNQRPSHPDERKSSHGVPNTKYPPVAGIRRVYQKGIRADHQWYGCLPRE